MTETQTELQEQQEKDAHARAEAVAAGRPGHANPGTLGTPPMPEKDQVEKGQGQPAQKQVIPYRAKFVVDEITRTTRGVAVVSLKVVYDANIADKQRLAPGANPKGDISIEVADAYANGGNVAHGTVFYLISAS